MTFTSVMVQNGLEADIISLEASNSLVQFQEYFATDTNTLYRALETNELLEIKPKSTIFIAESTNLATFPTQGLQVLGAGNAFNISSSSKYVSHAYANDRLEATILKDGVYQIVTYFNADQMAADSYIAPIIQVNGNNDVAQGVGISPAGIRSASLLSNFSLSQGDKVAAISWVSSAGRNRAYNLSIEYKG